MLTAASEADDVVVGAPVALGAEVLYNSGVDSGHPVGPSKSSVTMLRGVLIRIYFVKLPAKSV